MNAMMHRCRSGLIPLSLAYQVGFTRLAYGILNLARLLYRVLLCQAFCRTGEASLMARRRLRAVFVLRPAGNKRHESS
jgi:hypothetical protein